LKDSTAQRSEPQATTNGQHVVEANGHAGGNGVANGHAPPPIPPPDYDQTRRFLAEIMPAPGDLDGWATELRMKGAGFDNNKFVVPGGQYAGIIAGWFDGRDSLVAQLPRIKGVSCYVTFNPVRRDLLARAAGITRTKAVTKDEDILSIRWLYIDIDPVRPADISSTDEELDRAVERQQLILDEQGWRPHAMWGKSGNGAWILTRVDATGGQIVRALAAVAARYNVPGRVKIDTTTCNPSRIMCLPGTAKCKGLNTPDRPWRLATLDSPEGPNP
jgi:hypothetical protein